MRLDWAAVETRLQGYRRHEWPELPPPETVFAIVLRGVFDDVLLITALLALAWHVNGQQSSDIGARATTLLLRRQVIEGEGSRFTPGGMRVPVFSMLFSLLIRAALNGGHGYSGYGASLDDLIRTLNGMSERHVVPGRVYSSWGWRGLDEVRAQVLALLAANLPATGDDGVGRWVREFAANETLFPDHDASMRRIDSAMKACANALGEQLDQNLFERGVHALAPDSDAAAARTRLHAIFADVIAAIQEQRTERLRALPIDREKWKALTEAVSNALHPELCCFRDFRVERIQEQASALMEWRVNNVDKARFVTPSLSWESVGDLNRVIVEMFRDHLTSHVWRSLSQRPREALKIDGSDESFWGAVAENAQRCGPAATLFTAYEPIGASISRWIYSPAAQRPAGRRIEYVKGHPSGGGTSYVGTIDGVEVFTTNVEDGHSYLLSALMLEAVSYHLVTPEAFVSVEFEEGDNPWSGTVVVRFSQHVVWRDTPFIDLVTESAVADEEPSTTV